MAYCLRLVCSYGSYFFSLLQSWWTGIWLFWMMLLLEFCGMGSSESGSYSTYVEIVLRKCGQAFDWLFRDAANNDRHSRKLFIETYTFCSVKTFAMDLQLTPLQNNVAVCCCMILYFKLAIEVSVKIPHIFRLSIFFRYIQPSFLFFSFSLSVSLSQCSIVPMNISLHAGCD